MCYININTYKYAICLTALMTVFDCQSLRSDENGESKSSSHSRKAPKAAQNPDKELLKKAAERAAKRAALKTAKGWIKDKDEAEFLVDEIFAGQPNPGGSKIQPIVRNNILMAGRIAAIQVAYKQLGDEEKATKFVHKLGFMGRLKHGNPQGKGNPFQPEEEVEKIHGFSELKANARAKAYADMIAWERARVEARAEAETKARRLVRKEVRPKETPRQVLFRIPPEEPAKEERHTLDKLEQGVDILEKGLKVGETVGHTAVKAVHVAGKAASVAGKVANTLGHLPIP